MPQGNKLKRGIDMRTLKVRLSARESKYYPVEARYTLNGVKYSLVFCTEEEARHYCEDRFYPRPVTFTKAGDK